MLNRDITWTITSEFKARDLVSLLLYGTEHLEHILQLNPFRNTNEVVGCTNIMSSPDLCIELVLLFFFFLFVFCTLSMKLTLRQPLYIFWVIICLAWILYCSFFPLVIRCSKLFSCTLAMELHLNEDCVFEFAKCKAAMFLSIILFFFFSCIKMHFKRRKEKHTHHLRVINYQQGYDICLIIIVYLFWHLCTFNFFILFFFKKKMAIWFTPFYLLVLLAINKTMNLKWNSKEKVWEVRPCWFRII